jgi:hypothetical protein
VKASLLPLDRATHVVHALHREDRAWPETNCYVDLWIELLHALQLEPVAAMAFTVAADHEGDQWTFFKFPLEDLYESFGIDVGELTIWRPLPEAVLTQLTRGRTVIVELDAFHLPDTAGVSYRLDHVKTSVAVQSIDLVERRLEYFHNRGLHALSGADFDAVFRLDAPPDPRVLAPYVELVKLDRLQRPGPEKLARLAAGQLRRHLARRPARNPVLAYAEVFARDVEALRAQPAQGFHAYAFATLRQLGANFECAAAFTRWLGGPAAAATAPFEQIAATAKAMQFRLARVTSGKPYDGAASLATMAAAWDQGMGTLAAAAG